MGVVLSGYCISLVVQPAVPFRRHQRSFCHILVKDPAPFRALARFIGPFVVFVAQPVHADIAPVEQRVEIHLDIGQRAEKRQTHGR